MSTNIHTPSSKDINKHGISWADFRKILKYQTSHKKKHSVVAELFQADRWKERQTDITKLIFDFRNFTNAPKNRQYIKPVPLMVRTAFGGRLMKSLMIK
jgi:hypothetical protein